MADLELIDPREIWKEIPGFGGRYFASDRGRIRAIRWFAGNRWYCERIMKPRPFEQYAVVSLCHKGRKRGWRIHRLVLMAFVGPCPPGQEGIHRDGIGTNNCLSNLHWGTPIENHADKHRHGTMYQGESHHFCKVSDQQVVAMRRDRAAGVKLDDLAERYGITRSNASQICLKKTRRYVNE